MKNAYAHKFYQHLSHQIEGVSAGPCGGLVKENSVDKIETSVRFIITDLKNDINVSYDGILPNLFSEGKGVIAEGRLKDKKYFIADTILAKHDENYMPPEVSKILEKSK